MRILSAKEGKLCSQKSKLISHPWTVWSKCWFEEQVENRPWKPWAGKRWGFERAQFLPDWATCSDRGCSESTGFLKGGLELWHTWLWDCTGPFFYERAVPSVGCDISGLSQLVLICILQWQRLDLKLGFNQQLMLVFDDIHSSCNLKTSIKDVLVFALPFSANSWTRTFWWHFVSIS